MYISNEYIFLFTYHVIGYFSIYMSGGGYGIGAWLLPLCWIMAIMHVLFRLLGAVTATFTGPDATRAAGWKRFGGVFLGALLLNAVGIGLGLLAGM